MSSPEEFVITTTFDLDGQYPPSLRQLQMLFERLDRGALIAEITLASTGKPGFVRTQRLALDARRTLHKDPDAPRVLDVSMGSITVRSIVRGANRAAAFALVSAGLFGAADYAVHEASKLVADTGTLIQQIEHIRHPDINARKANAVMRGKGADPSIRLKCIEITPRTPQ
jgi:hypothetical protein